MGFAHLHTHTEYSLLDGSNKIKAYVAKCAALGMTSAAITDHGVMYGVIDFYKECKAAGINPVLGCEVYVAPGSRLDKTQAKNENKYYHLILLAENNTGYQNLMKIVSAGFVDGFYYKPRVDWEILSQYHEGIICLSACLAGEVAKALSAKAYDEAKAVALRYLELFGDGNYFLEMQDHGIPEQQVVNQQLMRLSNETGIPLVVTNDCHYTNAEDADSHDVLLCIQTGKKLSDTDRMRYDGGQYYVKSEEEMLSLFPYAKEAVLRTGDIADRCHVEIEFGVTKLPYFDVPAGYDSWTYLNKLCFDGLKERYPDSWESLVERLNYELTTIKNMGYIEYFLIVWDFINFARTKGIPVGPGRGSAAGSLVSYTTGITDIDPIRYSLIFERFLNPERVSMPDIDVDFCYERRSEVIDYVIEKYGEDCVTQIVTFGTLKARGVIRDVGRVMDLPYGFVDSIAKMVPQELGITLDGALNLNPELKKLYDEDESVKQLIDIGKSLEGLPRNTSVHAAGVVISRLPMMEYVPLSRSSEGTLTTQFIMTTIEELGLLKMDFLGLRTLTVINDCIKAVKANGGEDINFSTMSYDDPNVLNLIGTGKCQGIFQLESPGMAGFMKELKPRSLEDIIAGISLYRPGPMDSIPAYIASKENPDAITYDCPQMEPILSPTYGCIVYQEQVMQIVRDLAGYSMGRSDMVRRAMSKKKDYVMKQERQNFVYGNPDEGVPGCVANGIDENVANKIYDDMIDFAKYAFNKSHAAAYAVVAYQTAYLRRYHPAEFFAALLTSELDDTRKVSGHISFCRASGLEVLPPDINEGAGCFVATSSEKLAVRYGLYAIKGVGRPVVDKIIALRESGGAYKDIYDFVGRTVGQDVNKRAVENLILAGAMDCLPGNRKQKNLLAPVLIDDEINDRKKNVPGQMSLFAFLDGGMGEAASEEPKAVHKVDYPKTDEYLPDELLGFEKELMGVYVSGHPLDDYAGMIEKNITATTSDFMLDVDTGASPLSDNESVVVGGMISALNIKYTKNNTVMAFVTLEDLAGTVEVIVFPRDYDKYKDLLKEDSKIFIKGRVSAEEDKDSKLIAQSVVAFDAVKREVWIAFLGRAEAIEKEQEVAETVKNYPGNASVILYGTSDKAAKALGITMEISKESLLALKEKYGETKVAVIDKKVTFPFSNR